MMPPFVPSVPPPHAVPCLAHRGRSHPTSSPLQGGGSLGDSGFAPHRNTEKILGYLNSHVLSHDLIPPHVNFSHLTAKDYSEMYQVIMTVKENHFKELGLDACLLEDELNKVPGDGPLHSLQSQG